VNLPAEADAVCRLVRESIFQSAQTTIASTEELEAFLAEDVTRERVASKWGHPDAVVLGSYSHSSNALLGVVAGFPHAQRSFEIHLLFVAPHVFSQGHGSALLAAIEAVAERHYRCPRMLVDAAQTAAGFYERQGYQQIGTVCHGGGTAELIQLTKALGGPLRTAGSFISSVPSAAHGFAVEQCAQQQAARVATGVEDGVSEEMSRAFMHRAMQASAKMSQARQKDQSRSSLRRADIDGFDDLLAEHACEADIS